MRIFLFLILFSFSLHAATVEIIDFIPENMVAGSVYPINLSLCRNTPGVYFLRFNITNTTYEFSQNGTEFIITNCSYNSTERLYLCERTGIVGKQFSELNISLNLMLIPENYSISLSLLFPNEETYGVCNPAPIVNPPVQSSSSGSSSTGGSSFMFPRPYVPPIVKEPPVEPPKEEPKEEPVVEPKPIPTPVKPVKKEPKEDITDSAQEIIISQEVQEDSGTIIKIIIVVAVLSAIIIGGGVFVLKKFARKEESLK